MTQSHILTLDADQATAKTAMKTYIPEQERIVRLAQLLGDGDVTVQMTQSLDPAEQHATIKLHNIAPEKHPLSTIHRCQIACTALNNTGSIRAQIGLSKKSNPVELHLFYPKTTLSRAALDKAIIQTTTIAGSICAVSSCLVNFARKRDTFTPERYKTMCAIVEKELGFGLPAYNYLSTKDLRDHRDMIVELFPNNVVRNRVKRAIGNNVHTAHAIAKSYLKTFDR